MNKKQCFAFSITRPISVAKVVMEESPHSMISGKGALKFAVQQGFKVEEELMVTKKWFLYNLQTR